MDRIADGNCGAGFNWSNETADNYSSNGKT
jgi:hypothetical protein